MWVFIRSVINLCLKGCHDCIVLQSWLGVALPQSLLSSYYWTGCSLCCGYHGYNNTSSVR